MGAHVSSAGGLPNAPLRARAIGATALQLFTKTPNQWRERVVLPAEARAFRAARVESGIRSAVSHDSYLINLASPDRTLLARSIKAFTAELRRATALGLDGVVSHPGNYIEDRDRGLSRNAAAYSRCLRAVPGRVLLLLEGTAGTGTALGRTFEELGELRDRIDPEVRSRVAFCADTCHLYSAGYDLVRGFDAVWDQWDAILGLDRLKCLHLNDSATPFGSRRDRHARIGEGSLGAGPFRRIMTDPRFRGVPKILEPPDSADHAGDCRRGIRRLRGYGRVADRTG